MEKYINQCRKLDNYTSIYNHREKTWEMWGEDILVLDTETTSAWLTPDGKVIGYIPGKSSEWWEKNTPLAWVYIWMFSINDKVYYGRDLRDFKKVLDDLDKSKKFIIWVHNLSFEFEFLRNIITFQDEGVFARAAHKIMKAVPVDYPNIEFRCSYFLTNLSLDSWGKQIGLPKKSGDLDYEVVRTPWTKLTDTELGYCERDCEVVYTGICKYREKYGTLKAIPLTQTGTIRREVRNILYNLPGYEKKIKALVPQNCMVYDTNRNSFAGGIAHGNPLYVNMTITEKEYKELITHFDFCSSYPTQMCAKKYPMTPWIRVDNTIPSDTDMEKNAYILKLRFFNIKSIKYNNFIQCSKSYIRRGVRDNGRLIRAEEVYMEITEQDFQTVRECYKWDKMEVEEVWRSRKNYLPKAFIEYILELYENKTKLKGVVGQEDLYNQSKQYLNSLFGMCCTSIVQTDILYNNGDWDSPELTEDIVNQKLDRLRIINPKDKDYNRDYFLNYSWGVWIAAYARRELVRNILKYDDKVLYYDTDSIFMIGEGDFSEYNTRIVKELEDMCKYYNIDPERTRPKTIEGEKKQLGLFEQESSNTEFRYLGAKRYVARVVKSDKKGEDGKLHLTVAGINKEAVDVLEDNIDNFVDGINFDKDHPSVNKRLRVYCDNMPEIIIDGWKMDYKYGVNLRRNGYKLDIKDDYEFICDKNLFMKFLAGQEISENLIVSMRGVF